MTYLHPQIPLDAHGQQAGVDEHMVPLVLALWERGITTTNCCQGTAEDWNSAYISIAAESLPVFFDLVGDVLEITSHAVARGVNLQFNTCNPEYWGAKCRESVDFAAWRSPDGWRVSGTLRFPPSFLPTLTAAVLEAPACRS